MNQRIAYFGATTSVLSACFRLFNTLGGMTSSRSVRQSFTHPGVLCHVAATVVFGVMWLLCRRGKRSALELNVIDFGGLGLGMALFGAMMMFQPSGFAQGLIVLVVTVSMVVTHAVIVPATGRRTALVSAIACAPAPVATYIAMSHGAPELLAGRPWSPGAGTAYVTMWSLVTVVLSTFVARVIYGLRERVRKATELGQYTLEERIGEGGMGVVYRARHVLLRRPTAVKLLPRERARETDVQRFEREVQLTSSLTHPNTVAIYDFGRTPDGIFYYVMEYLDGVTLDELVRHDGPLPPARVVHILEQAAGALAEAHGLGLIHRDIKPANIMLCVRGRVSDHVKLLDFGLVKELHTPERAGLSVAGALLGTPQYLAPEAIVDAASIDGRVDIYALGAVAYELLVGAPLFEARGLVEICAKHLHERPTPPSERSDTPIPVALEALVLRCLEKDPNARPASVDALLASLGNISDLGPWTDADAARWWSERAPQVRRRSRESRSSSAAFGRTIAVDLEAREGRVSSS
jgi:serine/threonine-protein kinase